MATIPKRTQPNPLAIEKFLGLNEDTSGDTQLQIGESSDMKNYRITENYKLTKREGYTSVYQYISNNTGIARSIRIYGMWSGIINSKKYFLVNEDGSLALLNEANNVTTPTHIGNLSSSQTHFFAFGNKVYMMDGKNYYSYDGTTFQAVVGYVPLVRISTPPTGGGTEYEGINLLNGKKRQQFSGNGASSIFTLAENNLDSVDSVKVKGELKTTDQYTVNLKEGTVNLFGSNTPVTGVNNVEIAWTKGTGSRTEITKYRFSILYGGANDTRVFVYGDGSNRYRYSALADGVPSAEYFPALNYRDISSNSVQITGMIRHYDRLLIFTNNGEAWYSYYDSIEIGKQTTADFPTSPVNQSVGNVAMGQVQLIQNNPFTLYTGVQEWTGTNVRDERNVKYISKRVQKTLDEQDLSKAITFDYEKKYEYWISFGSIVVVYNYQLDVWYKFEFFDTITCFGMHNNQLYIGTSWNGLLRFGDSYLTDTSAKIKAHWESGFYDFEAEWLRKYINEMWISIQPNGKTSVDISYETNRKLTSQTYVARYNVFTFEDINFADFTFILNRNPQPFRFKIKAKKFVYFKLNLDNNSAQRLTILSINLASRMGSKTR
jgi:hypothetical protein